MNILKIKDGDKWVSIPALVGPKGDTGKAFYYVGTEEPEDKDLIWLNPQDQSQYMCYINGALRTIESDSGLTLNFYQNGIWWGLPLLERYMPSAVQATTLSVGTPTTAAVVDNVAEFSNNAVVNENVVELEDTINDK